MYSTPVDFALSYGISGYVLWVLCAFLVRRVPKSYSVAEKKLQDFARNTSCELSHTSLRVDRLVFSMGECNSKTKEMEERISALSYHVREKVSELEKRVIDNQGQFADMLSVLFLRQLDQRIATTENQIGNLSQNELAIFLRGLDQRISTTENQIGDLSTSATSLQKELATYLPRMDQRIATTENQIGDLSTSAESDRGEFEKYKRSTLSPLDIIKALCRPEIVKLFDMISTVPADKWHYDKSDSRRSLDMSQVGKKFAGTQIVYNYGVSSLPNIFIKQKFFPYPVKRLAERLLFSIYFPNPFDDTNFELVRSLFAETEIPQTSDKEV